jgi:hypothetical protein
MVMERAHFMGQQVLHRDGGWGWGDNGSNSLYEWLEFYNYNVFKQKKITMPNELILLNKITLKSVGLLFSLLFYSCNETNYQDKQLNTSTIVASESKQTTIRKEVDCIL